MSPGGGFKPFRHVSFQNGGRRLRGFIQERLNPQQGVRLFLDAFRREDRPV